MSGVYNKLLKYKLIRNKSQWNMKVTSQLTLRKNQNFKDSNNKALHPSEEAYNQWMMEAYLPKVKTDKQEPKEAPTKEQLSRDRTLQKITNEL